MEKSHRISANDAVMNLKYQRMLVLVSVVLFAVKILAWVMTGSVSILTDALESTVNVLAGFIGLYSVSLSLKPKDKEHPYGHGKIEFISSAVEGILIAIAGLIIIYEALNNLIHPHELKGLDYGLILVSITAIINFITGWYCVKQGKRSNSPVLIASGEHLKSDTYSTLGIILGVALILITGLKWIDSVAAIIFGLVIIVTGYKIIRRSFSGMMDESDATIINEIVDVLNKNRIPQWVDVHNMRVINYAGFYHIDCHLTVPFYVNVHEAHSILDKLTNLFTEHFSSRVEFFIHVDGCLKDQCKICQLENCPQRSNPFEKQINWTFDNIISNSKHYVNT